VNQEAKPEVKPEVAGNPHQPEVSGSGSEIFFKIKKPPRLCRLMEAFA